MKRFLLPFFAVAVFILGLFLPSHLNARRVAFTSIPVDRIIDRCPRGHCRDGTRLARNSWTDTPCGPNAVENTIWSMCSHNASTSKIKALSKEAINVNYNLSFGIFGDVGLGARDIRTLISESFKITKSCPAGRWTRIKPSSREYIAKLEAVTSGDRVALALVYEETNNTEDDRLPHWYVVEKVERRTRSCRVNVLDSSGRLGIDCKKFADMADSLPLYISIFTPRHSIVFFKKQSRPRSDPQRLVPMSYRGIKF